MKRKIALVMSVMMALCGGCPQAVFAEEIAEFEEVSASPGVEAVPLEEEFFSETSDLTEVEGEAPLAGESDLVQMIPENLFADGEGETGETAPVGTEGQEEMVAVNEVNFPGDGFRYWVRDEVDTSKDGFLSREEMDAVTEICFYERWPGSFQGIQFFPKLKVLDCCYSEIDSLDLSNNRELVGLYCDHNNLESLDLSANTSLCVLKCNYNKLTTLNVSACSRLRVLECRANQITGLDVSGKPMLETLLCGGNEIPELDVRASSRLEMLDCNANQLTSLDVSANPKLTFLTCSGNQLTELDVTANPELDVLECLWNEIASLDVSNNPVLRWLGCSENRLTSLDVSKNPELDDLRCSKNQIKTLDVSANPKLSLLVCNDNQLTRLDIRANPLMATVCCSGNQLTSFDLSNAYEVYILGLNDNRFPITVSEENTFDLSALPEGFDVNKASEWSGGSVQGTILTVDKGAKEVTYSYDVGKDRWLNVIKFSLTVNGGAEEPTETPEKPESQPAETPEKPESQPAETPEKPESQPAETPEKSDPQPTKAPETPAPQPTEAPHSHSFGEWTTVQEATVLEEGVRARSCALCGAQETEAVPRLDAVISQNVKTIPLKVGQSTTAVRITYGKGDGIASWESSNRKVASVSPKGKITGKKAGSAVITATLKSGKSAKILVNVQKAAVKTKKLKADKTRLTMRKGEKYQLQITVTPVTSQQKVVYRSTDPKVAAVNKKGQITAKRQGTAKIIITSGTKKVTCKVKVK